jgi:hypothetical protein
VRTNLVLVIRSPPPSLSIATISWLALLGPMERAVRTTARRTFMRGKEMSGGKPQHLRPATGFQRPDSTGDPGQGDPGQGDPGQG